MYTLEEITVGKVVEYVGMYGMRDRSDPRLKGKSV
jgi:hypothetical protein